MWRLALVTEWVDPDRQLHQLECIFRCEPGGPLDLCGRSHPDPKDLGMHWLPLSGSATVRLHPLGMRALLGDLATGDGPGALYLGPAR